MNRWRRKVYSDKDLALSASWILNDLMGEVHAGRVIGYTATKNASVYLTKYPEYFVRVGIGAIMIALYKYEGLWEHQLKRLLKEQLPARGNWLITEIKAKKISQFRSLFVAHYSDNPKSPKLPLSKLEELLTAQGFNNNEELFLWVNDVIYAMEEVRNRLVSKYDLVIEENKNP